MQNGDSNPSGATSAPLGFAASKALHLWKAMLAEPIGSSKEQELAAELEIWIDRVPESDMRAYTDRVVKHIMSDDWPRGRSKS